MPASNRYKVFIINELLAYCQYLIILNVTNVNSIIKICRILFLEDEIMTAKEILTRYVDISGYAGMQSGRPFETLKDMIKILLDKRDLPVFLAGRLTICGGGFIDYIRLNSEVLNLKVDMQTMRRNIVKLNHQTSVLRSDNRPVQFVNWRSENNGNAARQVNTPRSNTYRRRWEDTRRTGSNSVTWWRAECPGYVPERNNSDPGGPHSLEN